MEIHPPSEPIHNWRDLLTHLGVITIGLFIALSLESLVEYMHHRHIVREARENIRLEIEENHMAAQETRKTFRTISIWNRRISITSSSSESTPKTFTAPSPTP